MNLNFPELTCEIHAFHHSLGLPRRTLNIARRRRSEQQTGHAILAQRGWKGGYLSCDFLFFVQPAHSGLGVRKHLAFLYEYYGS